MSYELRSGGGPESRPSFGHGPRFDPVEAAATTTGPGQQSLNPPTQMGAAGRTSLFWENMVTGQRFMWLLQGTTVDQGGSLSSVQTRWTMDASADMTGDGLADILWTNHTTGERYVWYMSGLGDIGGGSLGIVGVNWLINGVGDFNGDNKADIVWTNTITGERYIWYMDGMTNTGGASLGVVPINWVINAVADMTGDGKVELIWTNTATGERYVWYMDGVTNTGGVSLGVVGLQWEIVGATDLTGDGWPELIWQDTTTGQRYVWYMDGVTNTGGFVLEQNSTDWSIAALSIDPPNNMPDVTLTTVSLAGGATGVAYNESLVAAGGDGTYAWSITSGALPPGLTLNPNTGVISGTPETNGTFNFTAQVSSAGKTSSRALSITISGAPDITTTALPAGVNGVPYSQTLTATGGTGTYTWAVTAGSLPTGLALNVNTGAITGTPTVNGTVGFTVQVTSGGLTDTQALSIQIVAPPNITTTVLAAGLVNAAYNQTLTATGGDGSYVWAVTVGSLPNGLVLNTGTGAITGTPTGSGTSNFTVQVTSAGATDTQALSITVNYPPPNITTTTLPGATQNIAYNQTLVATGGDGTYAWAVIVGSLPTGLNLNAGTGAITGTPTGVGTSNFTVQVTSDGVTDTQALSIVVTAAGAVWFEEDWSAYNVATDMDCGGACPIEARMISQYGPDGLPDGEVGVATGLTGTPWGGSKAGRVVWYNRAVPAVPCSVNHEPEVGIRLRFPNADVDQPREIWWEVYVKFDNFETQFCPQPPAPQNENKFIMFYDQDFRRWNNIIGVGSQRNVRAYINDFDYSENGNLGTHAINATNPLNGPAVDARTALWDGNWHQLRGHYRHGLGTAAVEYWIDGVLVQQATDLRSEDNKGDGDGYFRRVYLSSNQNHRPDRLMEVLFGRLRVYTVDQGW